MKIRDHKGNQVYSSFEYKVTGLGQEIAVLESDKIVFYNMKTQTILAEIQRMENANIAKQWFSIGNYMVDFLNGIIFDSESSQTFCVAEFAEKKSAGIEGSETYSLVTLNPESGDIIVCFMEKPGLMNQDDSGTKTVYVCNMDGTLKAVYPDLIMVQGIYGLCQEGKKVTRINLLNGETLTLPTELEMDSFFEMGMLEREWLVLTPRSSALEAKTVLYNNQIVTERCVSCFSNSCGVQIDTYTETADREIEIEENLYRTDGKKFEGNLKAEEIVYLSDDEIAVEADGKVVVMDWDGNEIAVIDLEWSAWTGENAVLMSGRKID